MKNKNKENIWMDNLIINLLFVKLQNNLKRVIYAAFVKLYKSYNQDF